MRTTTLTIAIAAAFGLAGSAFAQSTQTTPPTDTQTGTDATQQAAPMQDTTTQSTPQSTTDQSSSAQADMQSDQTSSPADAQNVAQDAQATKDMQPAKKTGSEKHEPMSGATEASQAQATTGDQGNAAAADMSSGSTTTTTTTQSDTGTAASAPATAGSMAAGTSAATGTSATGASVTSSPGNSIVGDYHIDFDTMDSNHDGNLSRKEAGSNATLMREFRAVDHDRNGRLSKQELEGWM